MHSTVDTGMAAHANAAPWTEEEHVLLQSEDTPRRSGRHCCGRQGVALGVLLTAGVALGVVWRFPSTRTSASTIGARSTATQLQVKADSKSTTNLTTTQSDIDALFYGLGSAPLVLKPFRAVPMHKLVDKILEQEPKSTKWHSESVLMSFDADLDYRGERVDPSDVAYRGDGGVTEDGKFIYEHGTTLSVLISALRNSNGQLVGAARRIELGITQTTGEALGISGPDPYSNLVVGGNLLKREWNIDMYTEYEAYCPGMGWEYKNMCWDRFALADAAPNKYTSNAYGMDDYGACENGLGVHGYKDTLAGNIPVLIIGDGLDNGEGYNFFKAHEEAHGWPGTMGEAWGKRLNIRDVLVADAQDPANDDFVVQLVKQLVTRIAAEEMEAMHEGRLGSSKVIYDDIRVGSYRKFHPTFRAALRAEGSDQEYFEAAARAVNGLHGDLEQAVEVEV